MASNGRVNLTMIDKVLEAEQGYSADEIEKFSDGELLLLLKQTGNAVFESLRQQLIHGLGNETRYALVEALTTILNVDW